MKKYTQGIELPLGFGLALEEFQAMNYFFSLPENSSIWLIMQKQSSQNWKCWHTFNQL
ncbi:hypothetical protein [Lacrimispora xylanisolvens]|uniref:hypothetical protein n=1 Tax=Lacrimispora xylanisolvens TaxID=384636 RepID=UPI002402990C